MRHGKKFNHLGRTADHRQAMLANMAISLIMHKRITTTLAKAKALKKYVEPLLTRSKDDSTNSRRVVFRYLQNKEALKELFGVVAEKIGDRPGGYTRVIKLGHRQSNHLFFRVKFIKEPTRIYSILWVFLYLKSEKSCFFFLLSTKLGDVIPNL